MLGFLSVPVTFDLPLSTCRDGRRNELIACEQELCRKRAAAVLAVLAAKCSMIHTAARATCGKSPPRLQWLPRLSASQLTASRRKSNSYEGSVQHRCSLHLQGLVICLVFVFLSGSCSSPRLYRFRSPCRSPSPLNLRVAACICVHHVY